MHDIVHELTIACPPEQVYDAVTTPDGHRPLVEPPT